MKKYTSFEEKKGTSCIRGNVYFGITVLSTNPCLRFLLICFTREIKGFYRSSFGNDVDFTNIMNISPNILAKNQNLKKLRHGFIDERAMTTTTSISPCHWKTVQPSCLQKERPENAFLILTVNYRKIVQKNKLRHSKQQ